MFVVLMFLVAHLEVWFHLNLLPTICPCLPDCLSCNHSPHIAKTSPSDALPGVDDLVRIEYNLSNVLKSLYFSNLNVPDKVIFSGYFDVALSALISLLFLVHNLQFKTVSIHI